MPNALERAAEARNLFIPDLPPPEGARVPFLAPGRKVVLGGKGVVVGGLLDLGDGRWAAVPGTFPMAVGTADECLDFLAEFTHCQTFPVVVRFAGPQMTHFEKNEDIIMDAVKRASRRLVGGAVEGGVVGTACWEA